ncbi:aldose epimerase family protein [Treponema sp.]|uniref:aldose epimerase family protein n=1 Tax=Treponema sp. TaxID=166 RepID=UPI00388E3164
MAESKKLNDEITLYTVSNGKLSFSAMNYGCTITNLFVPDKNGKMTDILLGFDSLEGWKAGNASHNAIVGRFANRITGAKFSLDGSEYFLDKNDGENCLHGGFTRYEKMLWNAEIFSDSEGEGVRFTRKSADGEQNMPGNLEMSVVYRLTENNELIFEYTATTDKATPVNLTNHAYFNLDGSGTILNHHLQLDCDKFLKAKSDLTPSGEIVNVEGTCFDFRTEKLIGKDIKNLVTEKADEANLSLTGKNDPYGYDHCFLTRTQDESKVVRFGKISSEKSGISMEIFTNQRGCHIYTGNFLSGMKGKGGVIHKRHDGICFETERFPNAVNEPDFPGCILNPGEKYWHQTILKF